MPKSTHYGALGTYDSMEEDPSSDGDENKAQMQIWMIKTLTGNEVQRLRSLPPRTVCRVGQHMKWVLKCIKLSPWGMQLLLCRRAHLQKEIQSIPTHHHLEKQRMTTHQPTHHRWGTAESDEILQLELSRPGLARDSPNRAVYFVNSGAQDAGRKLISCFRFW